MTDDLVKRLQELAAQSNDGCLRGSALQAADRIEELEAEVDLLKKKEVEEVMWRECHIEELEAEVATAREEGRRAGVKEAMRVARVHNLGRDYECSQRQIDAIHALIDKPADPVAEAARVLLDEMPRITAKPIVKMSDAMKVELHPAILLSGLCAALRALAQKEGE